MSTKKPLGEPLLTKLAVLISPSAASSFADELRKQDFYEGYQEGVRDTLAVILAYLKECLKERKG